MTFFYFLKIKLFFLISITVIIILAGNILAGYLLLPGNLNEEKIIIIDSGLSINQISKLLKKEKAISNAFLFKAIGSIYSYYRPFKSGEYKFTTHITPYQIIQILIKGRSIVHRVFIPEGCTVSQIINIINSEPRLIGKINSTIPEGHLMPSTYFYSYQDQRQKIIDRMLYAMSSALNKVMPQLQGDSPLKTRKDVLTLASIIEKEAGSHKEKPLIAGVFINRLKIGMRLQADPTTIYGITEGKRLLGRNLRKSDLKSHSSYNTYYIYGLPSTPICCPGLESLKAAVNPTKTDALYFVINGKGEHNFSNTLKKHNDNIRKFKNLLKTK